MSEPVCTQKAPIIVDVEEGQTYHYCACGRSQKQPYCDGSHQGTTFEPIPYTAAKTGKAYFCGCRASRKMPMCDGIHKEL